MPEKPRAKHAIVRRRPQRPQTPAFAHICLAALPPLLRDISWTCTPSTSAVAFAPYVSEIPICSMISAAASLSLMTVMAESLFKAIYAPPARLKPSDDELCPHCCGFGSVMCALCLSKGEVYVYGTGLRRQCPICEGAKRERCKRCAGTGTTGMKKRKPPQ